VCMYVRERERERERARERERERPVVVSEKPQLVIQSDIPEASLTEVFHLHTVKVKNVKDLCVGALGCESCGRGHCYQQASNQLGAKCFKCHGDSISVLAHHPRLSTGYMQFSFYSLISPTRL